MLQVVSVTFNEMNLEEEPHCAYDRVELSDYDNYNVLEIFCTSAYPITSSGSSLFVVFRTDESVNNGRFSLNWKFVSQGWLEWTDVQGGSKK